MCDTVKSYYRLIIGNHTLSFPLDLEVHLKVISAAVFISTSISAIFGRLSSRAVPKRQLSFLLQGGRHYSDSLCSDRRYSDNLQSGRPSTSLSRLAYVEIVEIGKNWNGSRRWMHRKHGIDRGTVVTEGSGAWGGYPSGSGVPPPSSGEVTTYLQHNCSAPDFRDLVRRLSNQYCP